MTTDTMLSSRLDRLEQDQLIRDLLSAYCYAVDADDFHALAALFVDKVGYIDGGVIGHHEGHEAIATAFQALTPRGATPINFKHMMGNIVIRHHDEGATVESYFLGASQEEGCAMTIGVAGRYEDEIMLHKGCWRFASRRICLDMHNL